MLIKMLSYVVAIFLVLCCGMLLSFQVLINQNVPCVPTAEVKFKIKSGLVSRMAGTNY